MVFRNDRRNDRDDRGFGRSSGRFGGGRGGDFRRDRRPLEMHDVICDKCKKECQVPFKPTEGKPVYCSECFTKEGGNSKSSGNSEQLDKINAKLDKILTLLESMEVVDEEDLDEDEEEEA